MQYFYVIKNIGHHACLREKEHFFRYQAYFKGNLLRFLQARARSCARANDANIVRSRDGNAKLRNYLKVIPLK